MTLDQQMLNRYVETLEAHPDSHMVIRAPDFPDIESEPMFRKVLRGELVHVMVMRGNHIVVTWICSESVQWIFDAYATQNEGTSQLGERPRKKTSV